MQDLTLSAARSDRDQLASRTDVLDKVGVLRSLSDSIHVTTDMVAEFYNVPRETIRSLVLDNRDEVESDGYRVVTRSAFEASFPKELTSSASRIALFPRRAVLRVGMLLRDSDVARQVRDHLLNVEASSRAVAEHQLPDRRELAKWVIEAENRADREKAARLEAEARTRELSAPAAAWKHLADSAGDYEVADAAKVLSRDPSISIGRDKLFRFMAVEGWIFRNRNTGKWKAYQTQVDNGRLTEKFGRPFLHEPSGEMRLGDPTIRVTAKGMAELHKRLGGSGQMQIVGAA